MGANLKKNSQTKLKQFGFISCVPLMCVSEVPLWAKHLTIAGDPKMTNHSSTSSGGVTICTCQHSFSVLFSDLRVPVCQRTSVYKFMLLY
jgi:hypothetical protein